MANILVSHSDHEAQPWGGPKADKNGGAGAEPPLTLGLLASSPAPTAPPLLVARINRKCF